MSTGLICGVGVYLNYVMTYSKIFFIFLLKMAPNFFPHMNERQLLIFRIDANPVLVQQQLHLLNKESVGFKERDIVITVVKKDNIFIEKYSVKPGVFTILLIGKDGTEKFRSTSIVSPQKLFALVDAMPMRQAEMKRNKPN